MNSYITLQIYIYTHTHLKFAGVVIGWAGAGLPPCWIYQRYVRELFCLTCIWNKSEQEKWHDMQQGEKKNANASNSGLVTKMDGWSCMEGQW